MSEAFLNNKVELHCGDMTAVLPTLAENSIDSCVCDPPYHLTSIVKRFGAKDAAPAKIGKTGAYARASAGFMGKQWDGGDIAFQPDTWAQVYRALKPGAHLVAFGGTRTYHRLAIAIEDAGFEIRDQIGWVFGSGFPKSRNIGNGLGTALKPAWEPIVLARKPLSEKTVAANVLKWGTGAINVDGCRIATDEGLNGGAYAKTGGRTVSQSLHGGSGMNVAGKTVGRAFEQPAGRWPANIITDGSEEVVAGFPESDDSHVSGSAINARASIGYGGSDAKFRTVRHAGNGSAARFFYTAKADADDRLGSKHPTVKPLDLMQYLVRLVTPPSGLVLDPFAGTGTTAEAAWREGMSAVLIEREAEYQDDIRRRMKLCLAGPDERARESIKVKTKDKPVDAGPLFDNYDAMDDFAKSLDVGYEHIRERVANGGPRGFMGEPE